MLNFKCLECENTTAVILIDSKHDLIAECLSCEHKELINDYEDNKEDQKVFAMIKNY